MPVEIVESARMLLSFLLMGTGASCWLIGWKYPLERWHYVLMGAAFYGLGIYVLFGGEV